MKNKCYNCNQVAKWLYIPGKNEPTGCDFFCDDCVPRGCSCNWELRPGVEANIGRSGCIINPDTDYYEPVDEDGRKYPCCEYWYRENGWEN